MISDGLKLNDPLRSRVNKESISGAGRGYSRGARVSSGNPRPTFASEGWVGG